MSWQPVLSGTLNRRAQSAIQEIAETMLNQRRNLGPTLASGHAGIALFYHHVKEASAGQRADKLAEEHLERAIDRAPELNHLGLFTGLTGIAWCLRHLREECAEATEDIDTLIEEVVSSGWNSSYDLIYGLAGVGLYVLDHQNAAWSDRVWQQILQNLDALRAEVPEGRGLWWTPPYQLQNNIAQRFPEGYYNLGMAHGLAGVIGLLARHRPGSPGEDLAHSMLSATIDRLFELEEYEPDRSAFPPYFSPVRASRKSARSGWCYGDPGIAISLFRAGQTLVRPDLRKRAIALAKRDATRTLRSSQVVDAPLCHGAAGLGHLYNRLYQATGDPELAGIARRWFEFALDLQCPPGAADIFPSWWPGDRSWQATPGFLDGGAGIGLALHAAISNTEPTWDRLILLNLEVNADPTATQTGRMRQDTRLSLNV